jgi:hypothetical protein
MEVVTNKHKETCLWNGQIVPRGFSEKDQWDCNTCTCHGNNIIACTEIYCPALDTRSQKEKDRFSTLLKKR